MSRVRKRGGVSKTSEMEMAEEAALAGVKRIKAILDGTSTDFKGAKAAQKDVSRYIRLQNQQIAHARTVLGVARQVAKLQQPKGRKKGGA